ncbi:MAG: hypothetical protein WCH44_08175 [Betaproteobacteria bacterium]
MEPQSNNPGALPPIAPPLNLKELAEILIRHYDFHDGIFEVGFQFNIAVGSVGPAPNAAAPGAVFAIAGVGLSRANQDSPLGVDAAVVNPINAKSAKAAAKKIPRRGSVAHSIGR